MSLRVVSLPLAIDP